MMKLRLLALFATLLLATTAATAQTSRGTVSGTVTDPNGAVVAGANVTLTNTQTTVSRETTTNDEGFYRFDAVDPGTYNVTVVGSGFGELTKTNAAVQAGLTTTIDAQLQLGGQNLTVDVTADAGVVLQTEAPVRGGNITTVQVTELPFSGRNPVSLALTLPGVSTNRTGVGIGTFVVNGARGRSNNFLIDGTENNDISVAGQGLQITNPDAVQEVNVQTSNYDAEFGRAGGAVVNTITKSGTNEFHGTLSYLLDSRVDDALTSSESRIPSNVERGNPPFGIENIYSATIGGPLYLPLFGEGGPSVYSGKNRTFFFGAYQEDRQRAVASSITLTTPTAAGRQQLRNLFAPGVNPRVDELLAFTANTVGAGGEFYVPLGVAPGASGTSSTTCNADGSGPAGNRPCIQFGNYQLATPFLSTNRQGQIRLDHKVSDSNQLSGRLIFDRSDVPNASPYFPGFGADQTQRYYNLLIADTHVFSPSFTNEVRIAYNRIQFTFPLEDPSGPAGTFPRLTIGSSVSALGASTSFPQGRTANNYVIQDTATYIRGNHTFRMGVDWLRQISTQAAPFSPRGVFTYGASTGYSSFANYIDDFGGSTGSVQRDFGSAIYHPSLYRTAAFFQDRWKVTDALTLTLGVRYENFGTPFNTLKTPAYTGLFNVNPVTFTGPYSEPNQVQSDNNNWAPTIGIAWSPAYEGGFLGRFFGNRQSVIRAGYQIGYDSFFNNIASNAATSSPNLISTTLNSTTAAGPRGLPNFRSQFPTTPNLNPRSSQTLITPNLVNPYYQRWSLGMQRELPWNLVMDVSYVGSRGVKLYINEDGNPQVRPELRITPAGYLGPTNCTPNTNITAAQALPGFPAGSPCPLTGRLDNIQGARTVRTNGGSSEYHSGQLDVRRRFSDNFLISGAYTWSKLMSNSDEVFATGVAGSAASVFAIPSIFGGNQHEWAPSQNDRTHRASFTYVYELPFFREQRGVGRLLGGWQLSGVTSFESGTPFTVLNLLDADGIGSNNDRPTYNPLGQRGVRAIPVVNAQGAITGYTNGETGAAIDPLTAEYIVNPAYSPTLALSVPRVGNLGRNTVRSPGINNWNVNVLKRTRVSEGVSLEFRTEFYNIFNHPQFTSGSVSPFSPTGGTINSNANTATVGRFLQPNSLDTDGGGRVIRYQLKLVF